MKNMKKILALLIAAMMLVGMVSALAAAGDATFDSKVSVTGLMENDVVHFYKIVGWDQNDANNVKGWVVASPFSFDLNAVLVGTPAQGTEGDPGYVAAVPATGITAELAGTLAKQAVAQTINDYPKNVTVGNGETSVELDVSALGAGIYMALITPGDIDTIYNPVFVSSDFTDGGTNTWKVTDAASYENKAAAKKSTTTLTKTAETTEASPDDQKWQTVAIGDTISFDVDTTIPGYGKVYTNPTFIIKDTMTDLTLDADSVTVTTPSGLTKGDQYSVSATTAGYTLTFSAAYLKTLTVPTAVKVEYTAKVATTATKHVNWEKNEVWTEYSHNPSDEGDHKFKKDDTVHYTFTLDADTVGGGSSQHGEKTSELVKIGVRADGTPITQTVEKSAISDKETWTGPLEGATFGVYRDASCSDASAYKPKSAAGVEGDPLVVTSGVDGRFTITGLDAGTYWIKELSAPKGFIKDDTILEVTITATFKSVKVTEYTNGTDWKSQEEYDALDATGKASYSESFTYDVDVLDTYTVHVSDGTNAWDAAKYTFTNKGTDSEIDWTVHPPVEKPFPFTNTQGVELPSTGGMGTTLLYVGGSILVILAAVLLITKRRMSSEE